jgi:hypothetical protein
MAMAVDCLAGYLRWLKEDSDTIPTPTDISKIDTVAIAKELGLDEPVGECFVNLVSVDVEAYSKEHFDKSVRKTLTIPAWLNTAALAEGINFSQTLQEALKAKLHIG